MSKLLKTPLGIAVFPHLNAPDSYEGKEEYKVKIRVQADDPKVQDFIEKMETMRDEWWNSDSNEDRKKMKPGVVKQMKAHPVYEVEYDEEGEETGTVLLFVKCNASYKRGDKLIPIKPKLLDAQKNEMSRDVPIWGGTELMAAFKPVLWAMAGTKLYGVKMQLSMVRIKNLVTSGGNVDEVFDDEDEDEFSDGYTYDEGDRQEQPATTEDESPLPDDDDEEF